MFKNTGGVAIGDGAMVTMCGSFRAGQPTKTVVIARALAIARNCKIRDRFFMASPPAIKWRGTIATARRAVNAS
jgi:hypothetical protein